MILKILEVLEVEGRTWATMHSKAHRDRLEVREEGLTKSPVGLKSLTPQSKALSAHRRAEQPQIHRPAPRVIALGNFMAY